MKKIMPFFMLLFMFVGGAWAQEPVPGKWYRIKDNTRNKYLTIRSYDAESGGAFGTVPVLDMDDSNPGQVWELIATGTENQYKIKSIDGYYLQCRTWNCDAVSTGGSNIIIEAADDGYYLKKNATQFFKVEDIANDGGTSHPFCNAPAGNANIVTWTFEEAATSTCTYNYTYNGNSTGLSEEAVCVIGLKFAFAPPKSIPDFTNATLPDRVVTAADNNTTIDVVLESDLPFEVSENYESAKWYYMNLRRSDTNEKWVVHSETVPYSNLARTQRVWETPALWAFVGNPIDGIQVLNRVAGENQTLGYDDAADESPVHMMEGTTTWTIGKADNNGGFTLHIPVGENQANDHLYIHDLNSTLKIWNSESAKTDNGSVFHVQAESDVFFQRWGNFFPWTTEELGRNDVPTGVNFCTGYTEDDANHSFRKAEEKIRAIGGNITVTFTYKSGNHMLKIAGVDIVDADGNVVKSDYHEGKAGGQHANNKYTLSDVPAGTYTMRYFVVHCPDGSTSNHDLTKTNGEIIVTGADLAEIHSFTYRFTFNGDIKITEEHTNDVNVGDAYPEIDTQFPYGIVAPTTPEGTITADDVVNGVGVKIIEVEEKLPFTKSVDFASATWYYVKLRGTKWLSHSETVPYPSTTRRTADYNGQWAFMGNPFDGFQVVNRALGEDYTLGYDGNGGEGSAVHMKEGIATWTLGNGNGGFTLRVAGSTNKYINDHAQTALKIYVTSNSNDPGSAFTVEAVDNDEHIGYQTWGNHFPWTTDDVTDAPVGVCSHNEGGAEHHLRKAETRIKAAGGDITVTFTYRDGTSMLMIAGVDLVNTEGEVIKTCYQEGKAGGVHSNNIYTLSDVEAGEYTMRYFVCEKKTGNNTHDLTHTEGDIVINGADLLGVDVKYIFTLDDVERATETHSDIDPYAAYPEITTTFPYGVAIPSKPAGVITTEIVNGTVTKTIELQHNTPFDRSEDFATAKWYVVDMHGNISDDTRYVWTYYNDGGANVRLPGEDTKQSGLFGDEKLWCFIGNAYDGFKIYNKAAGEGLTLNKPADGNTAADMSDAGQATYYQLTPTRSTYSGLSGAICFKPVGHTYYLNEQHTPKTLCGWNVNDEGSSCRIYAPTDFVKETFDSEFDVNIPVFGVVGSNRALTQERYDVLRPALEAIQADAWNTEAITPEVSEALSVLKANEKITLRDGGYYFIKNTGNGGTSAGSTNNSAWYATYGENESDFKAMALADGEKLGAKHVWKLEAAEISESVQGFKLFSCNLGKYATLANAPTVSQVSSEEGTAFSFTRQANSYADIIKENNARIMRTENNGAINYWGVESDETWYVIEAANLDIVVDEAEYATIHLPFAVTVPEKLRAYAVTVVDDETATLMAHDAIPANTGAILRGTGTHTLAITDEEVTGWEDNRLQGSNVTTYVEGNSYVLSNPASGIGLYRATLNKDADGATGTTHFKNNANKAYLPGTAAPAGARFFLFDKGGETAVENVAGAEDDAEAVVYDIAGRRVGKAGKGLYIVNGKKVIR